MERLLEAAGELLDETGHESLTVRMVAARAQVSPATAYTYFASKDHLVAELFWRRLDSAPVPALRGRSAEQRIAETVHHLAGVIAASPALAAAANRSLLAADPDVHRLRVAIGSLWLQRFRDALGAGADAELLHALSACFTGVLIEASMGFSTYEELPEVLGRVVAAVMRNR